MRKILCFLLVILSVGCQMGLEDAPFSGDYLFDNINIEAMNAGAVGEALETRITSTGSGTHKYLGDVSVNLQQDISMEDFKIVHKLTVKDKDNNTLLFVGKGNLLPKDDTGTFIYVSNDSLVGGTGTYAKATGKSTSQGEINLNDRKVNCIHRGIWSYEKVSAEK